MKVLRNGHQLRRFNSTDAFMNRVTKAQIDSLLEQTTVPEGNSQELLTPEISTELFKLKRLRNLNKLYLDRRHPHQFSTTPRTCSVSQPSKASPGSVRTQLTTSLSNLEEKRPSPNSYTDLWPILGRDPLLPIHPIVGQVPRRTLLATVKFQSYQNRW